VRLCTMEWARAANKHVSAGGARAGHGRVHQAAAARVRVGTARVVRARRGPFTRAPGARLRARRHLHLRPGLSRGGPQVPLASRGGPDLLRRRVAARGGGAPPARGLSGRAPGQVGPEVRVAHKIQLAHKGEVLCLRCHPFFARPKPLALQHAPSPRRENSASRPASRRGSPPARSPAAPRGSRGPWLVELRQIIDTP
jgi:hypothetical protein